MTVALIDDQLLGAVLRDGAPDDLGSKQLFTTGYWYVRLCQAVLTAQERHGALSRPFADLPAGLRSRALEAVLELPAEIGLVSLRELAPTTARLRERHQLNVLSIEALAAASRLRAEVFLSAESPRLADALAHENLRVEVVSSAPPSRPNR
jgi:hypothetical protein